LNSKKWYASKTIWTNVAALTAVGVQAAAGSSVIDPALQAALLAVTNAALRLFTSEPLA